ncbi:magnesium/cobalt transporter CorA [Paenibacillus sp. Marseille-Q4541]|uniref:magnesium/cobalt transporter CorA n=1 Tax=Paenibacillus sp. Marseille-Q4541 TaxID=2831522 RepID=UPI001BADCE02|nr:magnesium/cobalt transporter CorA [Paenibacillus sp. Marseille-Q4541]
MIRTLAITQEHEVVMNTPLQEMNLVDYTFVWADFSHPSEEETRLLTDYFHFHPLAVEDCLHNLQRPKLDYYDNVQFLVLHALRTGDAQPLEIDLFLGPNYLVSYHHDELDEINQAWDRIAEHASERTIWSKATVAAAYTVMDKLVDGYFPILFAIEDDLAELEGRSSDEPIDELMNQVFMLRSRLLRLRRTFVPMRDLLYRVINSQHIQGGTEHKLYFTDIYDHLLKLTDMLEADREMTADLRDSYISLSSNRMNNIMKTLTVITTIFMPLTLIAGIYGMNFEHMPELGMRYGYFGVLLLMVLLSSGMIFWFKKRGWFQ